MRKTCAILRDCFNLRLSAGGLSRALHRLATKVQSHYHAIINALREAPVVHSDETSWWVGGPGWWLWVFANAQNTLYLVDQSRGRSVLTELLGTDFGGVLVSDCLATYDDATPLQHKCYAHHHRAIRQAKALHPHQGEGFLTELSALLRAAATLKGQKTQCDPESFHALRQALERKAAQLLDAPRSELERRSRAQPSAKAARPSLYLFRSRRRGCH